jgi:hypothetical protein
VFDGGKNHISIILHTTNEMDSSTSISNLPLREEVKGEA